MKKIQQSFSENDVLVITGFQGITEDGDLTTLGRGGSYTSAVALAAALKSDCEIYSDVAGIYSTDPKLYPESKKRSLFPMMKRLNFLLKVLKYFTVGQLRLQRNLILLFIVVQHFRMRK